MNTNHKLYKRRPDIHILANDLSTLTYKQIAAKYKVANNTVKNWVTKYNLARIRRPNAPESKQFIDPFNKKFPGKEILAHMLSKHTQEEVAAILDVCRSTVCTWVQKYGLLTKVAAVQKQTDPYIYPEDKITITAKTLSTMKW